MRVCKGAHSVTIALCDHGVAWETIGGIWRAAPGDDENYFYAITL